MSTTPQSMKKNFISENDVHQYLSKHADFFNTHTNLLSNLEIPHDSGNAVSLVERQVSVLREQKKQLKKQLNELVQIANENDSLNSQLHKLTIVLYKSGSFQDVVDVTRDRLKTDYAVDESKFIFFKDSIAGSVEDNAAAGIKLESKNKIKINGISKILKEQTPVCGRFNEETTQYLFSDASKQVQSVALLPLVGDTCFGLLIIGSYDAQRFHADKGTEFLQKLAELVGCSLSVNV